MNPLPWSPPTDNLYKFLAIAGLVMAVFGYAYPIYLVREHNERETALIKAEMEVQQAQYAELTNAMADVEKQFLEDIDHLAKVALKSKEELKGLDKAYFDILDLKRTRMNEMQKAYQKMLEERHKELSDARAKNLESQFKFDNTEMTFSTRLGNFLAIAGVFLMFFGFLFWYVKCQRLQDKMLSEEARAIGKDDARNSPG